MTHRLKRFQTSQQSHFITFSCFQRRSYLQTEYLRDLFLECLERTRRVHQFRVYGYVVMPEHVHLLFSEPERVLLATAIQSLKVSFTRRLMVDGFKFDLAFWQRRYYDPNVHTYERFVQKLRYIHRNPVNRGLVEEPEDWKWSSFRHYPISEIGPVEIESRWTADRRTGRIPKLMKVQEG